MSLGKSLQTKLPADFGVTLIRSGDSYMVRLTWTGKSSAQWADLKTKNRPVALRRVPGALAQLLAELANEQLAKARAHQEQAELLQKLCKEELLSIVRESMERRQGTS